MSNSGMRRDIVRMYQEGHRVADIASATGVHRATVYNNLKAAGITQRDDRFDNPGVQRRTHCTHGHEFTEENVRVDKNGSRHCKMCEMLRSFMRSRMA